MPSSVTHNYFSIDVYNKLNGNIKKKIKPCFDEYRIFSQGPDPYFFYDFHLTKKAKDIHKINIAMQHSLVNKHFLSLINYINEKKYYSNCMVMAYLYGQICHFVLDSTCHPFIVYNTGMYFSDDKKSYKYNGLHEEMEYYIDCYLIYEREKIYPKNYKPYKELFKNICFNDETKDVIDTVTLNVYGFKNVSSSYLKSINDMKKFYYVFNYDKYGIKKVIYSIMDKICGNMVVKKRELSFNIDPYSKLFYLNNDNKEWCHPCDKNKIFNYSFLELYNIAIEKASNIIIKVDKMLSSGLIDNKELEFIFGNLDYGTGKDCSLNLKYLYYKF